MKNYQTISEWRANLYGLLSSVYIQIPRQETITLNLEPALHLLRSSSEGTEEALQEIKRGVGLVKAYASGEDPLSEKSITDLSKDWTRLFRGVGKDGPLPPYESLYRAERLQKRPVQEINRLFSKMGVRVPEEWHQPPDYIGVELDFMRLFCRRELKAWEKEEMGSVLEVIETERSFLENHLGLWIFDFCEKMLAQAREDFYRGVARLTSGLVKHDRIWLLRLFNLIHHTTVDNPN